jgi:hypothetical protein
MNSRNTNLNQLRILTDSSETQVLRDYSTISTDSSTQVLFRDLDRHLMDHIRHADVVVGCVAWLTHEGILKTLAETQGVSIIVQKEDFLRPDMNTTRGNEWAKKLRLLYDALPQAPDRYQKWGTTIDMMSYLGDPSVSPVRCVGNHNADRAPAFPRMHHKFVVFCRLTAPDKGNGETKHPHPLRIVPYQVWTGSFNFTYNASQSLENAMVSTDPRIVEAFYQEWGQIAALSEPLDWESSWVEPEWRIGS